MTIRELLTLSAALVLLMAGTGCSQKELMPKSTPPADDKMAREFMDDLRQGHVLEAEMMFSPDLVLGNAQAGLQQLAGAFRAGEVKNIEEVGVNSSSIMLAGAEQEVVSLSYQVELTSSWLVGTITIVHEVRGPLITGARFNREPAPLEVLNRFTFQGKDWIHYWFFAMALAIPLFSLWALVACVRSNIKRKWLWVIFILFGMVAFRLNWTTGRMDWALLNIQFLGASLVRTGFYGPWFVAISLPVGGIVFWLRRHWAGSERPTGARLFTPGQATLACVIGGPVAGGWLMARNFAAWGQRKEAWLTIAAGIGATLSLLVIGMLAPKHTGRTGLAILGVIGVKWTATSLQGRAVAAHQAGGGPIESWWKAFGLGLLNAVVVCSAVILVLLVKAGAGQ